MISLEPILIHRCYADNNNNNTAPMEGYGNLSFSLLPLLSLQMHCYP